MNHKNSAIKIIVVPLIICAIFFLAVLALLINYDHLQLRKHDFYDGNKFSASPAMRIQAMGIINNVDFNSVILGTSLIETAKASEASKLFGGKFVNLSIRASTFYERYIVLKALFREKNVKNVIYSFEFDFEPTLELDKPKYWELLYDKNIFNDLFVLFDANYVTGAFKFILPSDELSNLIEKKHYKVSTKPTPADIEFFDTPIADWVVDGERDSLFGGLEFWAKRLEIPEIKTFLVDMLPKSIEDMHKIPTMDPKDINIDKYKDYIDKYILSFVKEHPETKFDIIQPPYYRAYYAIALNIDGGKDFYSFEKAFKYLVEQAEKYDNLSIYAFGDQNIAGDIKNFRDVRHYKNSYNSYILQSIAEGKHKINLQNVDAYLAKFYKLAKDYDLQKIYDESQKLLRQNNHTALPE